jgi:autotransporter-associated beta strand protein
MVQTTGNFARPIVVNATTFPNGSPNTGKDTIGTPDFAAGGVETLFSGDITLNSLPALQSAVTLQGGNDFRTRFSGVISGTGTVTVAGTASNRMVVFSGNNTYTGTTTVASGTLAIDAGGSLASGSVVTVNNGATLAGTGTINGRVSLDAGGAIRGDVAGGTGTLTIASNDAKALTINSTASASGILRVEASRTGTNAANASRIALTDPSGILHLDSVSGGKFTIDLVNGTNSLQLGETYTITLATVANAGNIQLNGTTAPATIDPSNYILQSSAFANFDNVALTVNGGTSLVLTFMPAPVPEPATVLGLAAAALGLAGWVGRKRRRQNAEARP